MKRRALPIILIFASILSVPSLRAEPLQYDSHGKRDPMVPLIGQEKSRGGAVALADIASVDDVKLEGIVGQATGKRAAIINGELVKENFKIGEIEVKKITKDSVVLTISGKEYTVPLPEEGG